MTLVFHSKNAFDRCNRLGIIRLLLSLLVGITSSVLGIFSASAATIGADDWMQPQIIAVQRNSLHRIEFRFCPHGNPADSNDCRTLGGRVNGYQDLELRRLADAAESTSETLSYIKPTLDVVSFIVSMQIFRVIARGASFPTFVVGGALMQAATDATTRDDLSPDYWTQIRKSVQPKMAHPNFDFKRDVDIVKLARTIDQQLKKLPNFFATCGCRSTHPASTDQDAFVRGAHSLSERGAIANAEFNCMKFNSDRTGRLPRREFPDEVFSCQIRQE